METLIESERERKGLSRIELGEALTPPVTEITVSEWEKGTAPIPSAQLLNLTRLFRCSVDYLLGLTDERTPMTLESDSPAVPTI